MPGRWDYPPPPVRLPLSSLAERIRQDQRAPVDPAAPIVVMVSRQVPALRCAAEVGWCWTVTARTLRAWWGRCDSTIRVCRGGAR